MFPIAPMMAHSLVPLLESNRQEQDKLLRIVHSLALTLQQVAGKSTIPPELNGFIDALQTEKQDALMDQLNDLSTRQDEPGSAREFRDLTGLSWDAVHSTIGVWKNWPSKNKRCFIRSVLVERALRDWTDR